jgi:conjugative relaxase-like TrwC/TraI family protein
MVSISKALSSAQAQRYHQLEFTSETQSYYKQDGAVQGEWQGRLAETFGLTGTVDAAAFARLSEGRHPETEAPLVRHREAREYTNADGTITKAVEHRAGWDATFSAPKSVSLTALVGGDARVREAHGAAVTIALMELERYTQARIGGNHPAETTGKFLAAKFEHDTARPVDGYAAPQLHTHAVIFNVTERTDSSTRALQERALFDSQSFATAVYQSALTYELRNRGYEIETGRSGAPEIAGYSQEYLGASSPRSQQIREHLEKFGRNSPGAAQIAAHATRDSKQLLSPGEVLSAHREMAAAFGNQPRRVVAEARERAHSQERKPDEFSRAQEAVAYAKSGIFEREAVADERGILRDALRRGMGETTYAAVRAEFDMRRSRGEFLEVAGRKHGTGRGFTTPETIANERANVAHVMSGQKIVEPIMTKYQAAAQAQTRAFLNEAQRTVIEEVLTSPDRIHGLQGLAGSGKTTVLASVREGAERSGYIVEGLAPSSKAAGALREAGIDATTLQSFLAKGGQGREDPAGRHLYMLDESSLASTRQMRAFLDKIGPQDRVLVIGDTRQHQAVDAGRPFQQMQEAGMRTSRLDRIVRQKDPGLLAAVEHLARGETAIGVKLLAEQGRVTEIASANDRIAAIARDYAAQPHNTLIVSPDNRSRVAINQAVRVELQANGKLAKDGRQFSTLAHRSDMTGADRMWAARYTPGDVLQYTAGSKAYGIERGSYAVVQSVDAKANTLTIERQDGQVVSYDPKRLKGVNVYREASREIAVGERVQFTASHKDLGVANRDLGTVTGIEPNRIAVRMDGKDGRVVTFDPGRMRHFDHGYAVTSHSAQGLTTGRVLVNMDGETARSLVNSRLAYVAISRASDDARIYTNDAVTIGQRLAAEVTKTAAVDFRPPAYTPTEIERHHAPIRKALDPQDAAQFQWKGETGTVQTYQHTRTGRNIHIDGKGQFYGQDGTPTSQEAALERAMPLGQAHAHGVTGNGIGLGR